MSITLLLKSKCALANSTYMTSNEANKALANSVYFKSRKISELCPSVLGKRLLNFTLIDIEPNQPITLALTNDVMNFISLITREGMKSKCSFWQSKSHTTAFKLEFDF